jgi:hypothetical protein
MLSVGDIRVVELTVVNGDEANMTTEIPTSRGSLESTSGATATEIRNDDDDGTTVDDIGEEDNRRMPTTADGD